MHKHRKDEEPEEHRRQRLSLLLLHQIYISRLTNRSLVDAQNVSLLHNYKVSSFLKWKKRAGREKDILLWFLCKFAN